MDYPELSTFEIQRTEAFDELAAGIGYICRGWAELELRIDFLLLDLLRVEPCAEVEAAFGNLDFLQKSRALLALAHKRGPNPEWYSRVESIVKELQGPLREQRNRYVHDYWFDRKDEALRIDRRGGVRKRKDTREPFLMAAFTKTVKPEDVWQVVRKMQWLDRQIDYLWFDLEG